MQELADAIEAVAGVVVTRPISVTRLSGGHAWTTLLVRDGVGHEWVVRLAPAGGTMEPYDPAVETGWIEAAGGAVPAPRVLGLDRSGGLLGSPFSVQTRVPGEVLRLDEVPEVDRPAYRRRFASALGILHREGRVDEMTADDALATEWLRMFEEYRRIALHRHPGFEIGLRWLRARLPSGSGRAVLCHGDYRFANISWTGPGEMGAVLDWERAWVGDPMADIAFTRQFSGWCAVDGDAVDAYEETSGIVVDEHRVAYGLRFERVRAYLSPLRLMRAIAEGRVDDPRLAAIAEAGEAGIWELVAWGDGSYLPPLEGELPPVEGPDWSAGLEEAGLRAHFDAHPRPAPVDPGDDAAVAAAVRSWSERPAMRRRRTWR
jgi:aminoglycoside phosphotransferase (APT) family kinase protein